jgi:hypothetical protein
MLNADNRFSGFAMRIKEDQCSYTNHQNNVTYYNMVNQQKIQNCQLYNKIPLPLSFTTIHKYIHTHINTHTNTYIPTYIHTYINGEETPNHKSIRKAVDEPIHTEDDMEFTPEEIKPTIESFNENNAPGMDGITGDIYKSVFHAFPRTITTM